MQELLELRTGQVAFISGLMSGFSLSVAAHVLRVRDRSKIAQLVFSLYLVSSLLFLLALYVDVRLTIALAGVETVPAAVLHDLSVVRTIGTAGATMAMFVFMIATGLLGWLSTPITGTISTLAVSGVLYIFWLVWQNINAISLTLQQS